MLNSGQPDEKFSSLGHPSCYLNVTKCDWRLLFFLYRVQIIINVLLDP